MSRIVSILYQTLSRVITERAPAVKDFCNLLTSILVELLAGYACCAMLGCVWRVSQCWDGAIAQWCVSQCWVLQWCVACAMPPGVSASQPSVAMVGINNTFKVRRVSSALTLMGKKLETRYIHSTRLVRWRVKLVCQVSPSPPCSIRPSCHTVCVLYSNSCWLVSSSLLATKPRSYSLIITTIAQTQMFQQVSLKSLEETSSSVS
jgi:hypothetical protein